MRVTSIATGIFCLVSLVVAQPPPDSPPDACCCCDISRNVISCNRSIMKQDCVCAAVVCPANAPTVYVDGPPAPTSKPTKPKTPPVKQTPAPVVKKNDIGNPGNACCCCDISRNVISCTRSISKDQCFCAAVMCPSDAPTVWDDEMTISKKDQVRPPPSLPVEKLPPPPNGPVAGKPTPVVVTDAPHAIPSTKGKPPGLNDRPKRFVTVTKPAQTKPMPPGCVMPPSPTGRQVPCCCCNPGINKIVCEMREEENCICALVACPKDAETTFVKRPVCTNI